jgi:omega-6 fatty acid desaturase (delta-12 desaturase)
LKCLNDLIGILSAGLTFVNFYSFQHAHSLHHANIGNLDAPEAGAPVSPKGQGKIRHGDRTRNLAKAIAEKYPFLWLFVAWPIFVFDGDYNSWVFPFSSNGRVNRKSVGTFVAIVIAHLAFLILFPLAYLGLFLPGMLLGGNRFITITYLHHAHDGSVFFDEDHHNFYNAIMANTDRDFGPVVNFFMMNNGYHVAHHLNSQIAYYDLKRASDYLRSIFPKDMSYPYVAGGRLYRDLARGKYEQRISENYEFFELKIPERYGGLKSSQ